MNDRPDRLLPGRYVGHFVSAVEAEMGDYSLRMILRDASLEQKDGRQPGKLDYVVLRAAQFAAIQAAIRAYYGSGARGSLNRVGRLVWRRAIGATLKGQIIRPFVRGLMPSLEAARMALNMLASLMKKPAGDVSVHLLDTDLIFMDTTSDATFGQEADHPICWYTVGLIQASIEWVIGEEKAVDEITCRAMGADACKFKIDL